jgi:chromosome segregation ATPase
MTDRTKWILAITLGSVGLALGLLGTIVAFNARSDIKSNQEITAVVEAKFAEAQKRQDDLESRQVSEAEKLVNSLSASEKNQLGKIDNNVKSINGLRNRLNTQQQEIDSIKNTNQQQSKQISNLQTQVQNNFNSLNNRIDQLTQQVNRPQSNAGN